MTLEAQLATPHFQMAQCAAEMKIGNVFTFLMHFKVSL